MVGCLIKRIRWSDVLFLMKKFKKNSDTSLIPTLNHNETVISLEVNASLEPCYPDITPEHSRDNNLKKIT